MEVFIVIQIIVESEVFMDKNNHINLNSIVRRVEAKTKAEAIGEFVIETASIPAKQKLNIECYSLAELISIITKPCK